jgi:hypothetical protein
MKRASIVFSLVFTLSILGCSVKFSANPPANLNMNTNEICVIKDKDTREEFITAYQLALEKKGFIVRVLDPGADINSCPLASTYTGSWSWDFVMYMAAAEIIIYKNGTRVGDALYDAPKAGWALTPRIYDSTEEKIGKMVDQLFPSMGTDATKEISN